jgi:hypothetical protein
MRISAASFVSSPRCLIIDASLSFMFEAASKARVEEANSAGADSVQADCGSGGEN